MTAMDPRGRALKANAVIFLLLTSVAMLMRIWVRLRTSRRFHVDDWILLLAVAFFMTSTGLYLISLYWGLARSVKDPNLISGRNALHAYFSADIFYSVCSIFLKLAAAVQITRHTTRSWQKKVVWVFATINIILNVYMIFAFMFRCTPVDWFWERMMYNPHRAENPILGRCHAKRAKRSMHSQSIIGAGIDFVFATLPAFIMKDLNLSAIQKLAVWIVVILAEFSGVAMIARIPAIMNLRFPSGFPYSSIPFGILNTIESGLIILALCLATLSRLLPGRPTPQTRWTFNRFDNESQFALHSIPLESNLGNTTHIESRGTTDRGRGALRTKSKKGRKLDSVDTLESEGWNDAGIMKTTETITTRSLEQLGKIAEPAPTLKK